MLNDALHLQGSSHAPRTAAGAFPRDVERVLTSSRLKRWLIGSEIYFREAVHDFQERLDGDFLSFLRRWTFILLKPDGILTRRLPLLLSEMSRLNFRLSYCKVVDLNYWSMRELWRYEMNRASLDRLQAIDILLTVTPSLLLVFEDTSDTELLACDRLTQRKGHALVANRRPGDLRVNIDAGNGLFNHIHVPDEPIDMIREFGILMQQCERQAFIDSIIAGAHCDVEGVSAELDRSTPAIALDLSPAIDRIEAVAQAATGASGRRLLDWCATARTKTFNDWPSAMRLASSLKLNISPLDWIVVAGHCTNCDVENIDGYEAELQRLIDDGGP